MPAECFPRAPSRKAAQSCSHAPERSRPVAPSKPVGCPTQKNPERVSEAFLRPCGGLPSLSKKVSYLRTKKRNGRAAHCQRSAASLARLSIVICGFDFRSWQGSILRQGHRVSEHPTNTSSTSAAVRTVGFIPLLALFYGYTAGGPFGYEEIFSQSGPGMALVFLTFLPMFWSIPIPFASAVLKGILPVQVGFYRWR